MQSLYDCSWIYGSPLQEYHNEEKIRCLVQEILKPRQYDSQSEKKYMAEYPKLKNIRWSSIQSEEIELIAAAEQIGTYEHGTVEIY